MHDPAFEDGAHDAVAQGWLRLMPGRSGSLLMLDQNAQAWVVKFQNNPQHRRVLINDYITTRIGTELGLTFPACGRIRVGEDLATAIQHSFGISRNTYSAGVHFGSRFAGGLLPGLVVDRRCVDPAEVINGAEVAGIYALDIWLNNTDHRQAVFTREMRGRKRKAVWIDHGYCFGGSGWKIDADVHRREYYDLARSFCPNIAEEVELWVERIQRVSLLRFHTILEELPSAWCKGDERMLVDVMAGIFRRRRMLHALIAQALRRDFGLA